MFTALGKSRLIAGKGSTRARIAGNSARAELPYLVCAALALVAIWGHRYPVGVDIAQHANLLRIAADMTFGPTEYRGLYHVDLFTPYLLAYVIAYPFTLLFGAVAAVKCLLTLAVLGTPLMMRRLQQASVTLT